MPRSRGAGNGNNGVITGGYDWVDGKNGGGLQLDGIKGQDDSALLRRGNPPVVAP